MSQQEHSVNDQPSAGSATERELFFGALECPTPREREAYLDHACGGDRTLRDSVEDLLRNHIEDSFLEKAAVTPPTPPCDTPSGAAKYGFEKPGDWIGPYKLLQEIGEGGCGTVFMAEQQQPLRRRVAIKVIKPGMDTKSVTARFESERQALAMMDHPNIARVLDAGATEAGRPYFVMELVRGVRITEYCDHNGLDTRERLLLFVKVCNAIQHAHQKGVIHRDIKPSNILVTLHDGEPVPKVIDFGIAKAVGQRLTDITLFTELQAFVGTPAYTSPEQAEMSGLDIDTRSDIYSLGVLLYELLTGKTPFDAKALAASGLDAMRKTIREVEPARPSAKLRQTLAGAGLRNATGDKPDAGQSKNESRRLLKETIARLRGDLDWIVMKCLEKDRTRRYETVNGLATDIERHLSNEPVAARPPSAGYRLLKFARRNKLSFAAASAFAGALVIGLSLAAWQYWEKSAAYRQVLEAQRQQLVLLKKTQNANLLEMQLRKQAETQELAARQKAYAADINLLRRSLEVNNLGQAHALLDAQKPKEGQSDLRGWEWRYLWQHCQSDALFTLCQLTNEVCSVAASPDGKWVAASETFTGELSVWDLRARQEIARMNTGERRPVAAFSPVTSLLAFSSSEDGGPGNRRYRVRLWDAGERRYISDFAVNGFCHGLSFSSDGKTLAISIADSRLALWNVAEGKLLASHTLPQMAWRGATMRLSANLRLVAEGSSDGKLRVWDLTEGKELWNRQAAEESIMALAFSPDGKILASGAGFTESSIHLWDAETGEELALLEGHRTFISALLFWPNGATLASASGDQTIRLWDVSDLRKDRPRVDRPRQPRPQQADATNPRQLAVLRGHKLEVWSLALLPDATTLVSGCKDGSVSVWDTASLPRDKAQIILPEEVRSWSFAPDSQSILAADKRGRIVRFSGSNFQDIKSVLEFDGDMFDIAISSDGHFASASIAPGKMAIWDLERKALIQQFKIPGMPRIAYVFDPHGKSFLFHSPDDSSIHQWDLATGRELRAWPGTLEPGGRFMASFSPDSQRAFRYNHEGMGRLLCLSNGREIGLNLDLKQISRTVFSPNGKYLAAVSGSGVGLLYDTATARKLATLRGFLQGMMSAAFSPDEKRLAIGSNAREAVKLWDTDSYHELLTLEGQGSFFHSTAFSPDGNILGSINMRGTLFLWRAPSMEEIGKLEAR